MIRQAYLEEKDYLSDLTLQSKAYWGYEKSFLERCRPHLKITEDYIKNWPVKVLEMDGKIVGYFSLKVISGENRLDNLWINPQHLRKGYGTALFIDAASTAEELDWKYLRLATDKYAMGFYKKLGFKEIGKVQSRLGKDIFLKHMELLIR